MPQFDRWGWFARTEFSQTGGIRSGVPAVLGELGDEGLLPLGQLRWLGNEGGGQRVALDEEGVDGASEVAGDEQFELGVGEEAVLRARVLEAVDGLLGLRDGIVRPGAIRGADEADDGIAGPQVLGQHAFHVVRGGIEVGLDDRLNAALPENLGDSFREGFESGSSAKAKCQANSACHSAFPRHHPRHEPIPNP